MSILPMESAAEQADLRILFADERGRPQTITMATWFVNADMIAAERWPGSAAEHAYDVAELAVAERSRQIADRRSSGGRVRQQQRGSSLPRGRQVRTWAIDRRAGVAWVDAARADRRRVNDRM
ncbi:hypothetical protein ACWDTI_24785 [Gordonia sp. NPDC003424]